jgi:tripartite-type tricarboxylate transporter receptor subunit TctC
MTDPKLMEQLRSQGFEPDWSTPEQFGTLIASEADRWGKVVKATGAKAE